MKHFKYLFIALAVLSCTKKQNFKAASVAAPVDQTIDVPICGTINMTPANNIYNFTNVAFEAALPNGDVQALNWVFKKDGTNVFASTSNSFNHTFNGVSEGYGNYTATLTFRKSDGNSCALEKSFQVLKDDLCVKPAGISGPTIGYVGEEVEFSLAAEPCFQGQIRWDLENDGTDDFILEPSETVKHTYTEAGTYTVKTIVIDFDDDQAKVFTHDIEIRYKTCTQPFTGTPVQHGEKVRFAKRSDQCGQGACATTEKTCNNGVFDGDDSYTENPATCPVSQPCPVAYEWVATDIGKCTGPCDSENGTRTLSNFVCRQIGTTTVVNDVLCASLGTKPTSKTENCTVAPEDRPLNCLSCGSTPHNGTETRWAQSSTCGTACTSQTQTCNNGVMPAFGSGFTYTSQSACPVTACYTYSWKVSEFGSCSATQCGTQGVQTRNVTCTRNDGVSVADSYCSGAKPATSQSCSARACYACNLPWGGMIAHTATVTAYKASAVSCGGSCASETRTCNDGVLSGSFTSQSCKVDTCVTPLAKGSSCIAFMGTSIKWTDPSTGKSCGGNLYGTLINGDYMQIGGSEVDSSTNWMIPWDKAKYKGSAKVACDENTPNYFGAPSFVVVSGTCTKEEPIMIPTPKLNAATPSTCFASPVAQQPYGTGACADYRQTSYTDMPMKAVAFNNGVRKYPNFGEYADSFTYAYSPKEGHIYTSAGMQITYKGETGVLSTTCGSNSAGVPDLSTCKNSASITLKGVTFTIGVGAKNTIDQNGYVPKYLGGLLNSAKTEVWSQRTCGVVTVSTSLGYLPPPCP